MKPLKALLPLIAGLVITLTYLLAQAMVPDANEHERTLEALQTINLYNAALQRDVLRARAGLLRSYDPLVQSIAKLREATDGLAIASETARDLALADIVRRVAEVTASVRDQETLSETFKSD